MLKHVFGEESAEQARMEQLKTLKFVDRSTLPAAGFGWFLFRHFPALLCDLNIFRLRDSGASVLHLQKRFVWQNHVAKVR